MCPSKSWQLAVCLVPYGFLAWAWNYIQSRPKSAAARLCSVAEMGPLSLPRVLMCL